MSVPGVGEVTAFLFKAVIDEPSRFRKSTDVGAYLGLTPRIHSSGEKFARHHRISKAGNQDLRTALFLASMSHMYRYRGESEIKKWGESVAARRGGKVAIVAVARKMAVVLHRIWTTGESFRTQEIACA